LHTEVEKDFRVGNLLSFGNQFSAHLSFWFLKKAGNTGISCDFRIGRGLAITQSHQDIVRDWEGVSA